MIEFTEEQLSVINLLIYKRQRFTLFRLPGDSVVNFRLQLKGEPKLFSDLSQLNGESGFVIAPFEVSDSCPIVLLKPDLFTLPTLQEAEKLSPYTDSISRGNLEVLSEDIAFERYHCTFNKFINEFSRHEMLQKLVLSRTASYTLDTEGLVAKAYEYICNVNPNGYAYLVYTPQTGLWMGITPEILLTGKEEEWRTVALAGTQKFHAGELVWDSKNIEEQAIVARYVERQLNQFGVTPHISGPQNIKAGKIVHLVSHFKFKLADISKLGDLLKLLHPTPAVCGLPKDQAYQFILNNENHKRRYYSGFIGELNGARGTRIYVNLRCMQIEECGFTLYAGGGILSSSQLNTEWQETINKMDTIQAAFKV